MESHGHFSLILHLSDTQADDRAMGGQLGVMSITYV